MRLPVNNPLTNFLLAGCCLLILIIGTEWLTPYQVNSTTNVSTESTDVQMPDNDDSTYVHPHIDDFSAILARPIFFPNRELPIIAVADTVAPRLPLRLKLEGIASTTGSRVAVLRDQGNNQLLQLSVGMSHNDWLLENMSSTAASFRRGDDITELTLETQNR
jgi:hypothetical protein